jgi:tripartite ATP-independent transporter DctP family solute receptor
MRAGRSSFILGLLCGLLLACVLFAWLGRSGGAGGGDGGRVLRVAHGLPEQHPVHGGIVEMARLVEQKSGGRLRMEIFPNEQLGSEVQCLEQVQLGSLAITKVSAAPVGNFVPVFQVFSLPFLFRDEEHYWRVLDGEIGGELLERIATRGDGLASGLHGLTYYDAGSRSFYTHRPILRPADLAGLKIRTMSDPVAMDMVEALGGAPTPIAWGELYTALRQGTVDGAENNAPSFLTSRHHEICKHFSLNHHSRIPDVLVMSDRVWGSLTPEEQAWVAAAAAESSAYQRALWREESDKALAELIEAGVTVHEVDPAEFVAACRPVIEKHAAGEVGKLVERIRGVE